MMRRDAPRPGTCLIRLLALFLFLWSCEGAISGTLEDQRDLYTQAKAALAKGDLGRFRKLKNQLRDYPLYPYLEYADISINIGGANPSDISRVLTNYKDLAFAPRLRQRWLGVLAKQNNWRSFIDFYEDASATTELQCQYAYALQNQGRRDESVSRALILWQVGKSQSSACDPIFNILVQQQGITDQAAWKRFTLATFNHQYNIARYARKFLSDPDLIKQADLYSEVDHNPRILGQYDSFHRLTDEESEIIVHGITHLAPLDAQLALKHWNRYNQSHRFSDEQTGKIISSLVKGLYLGGHQDASDNYLLLAKDQAPDDILEWRLRELVKNADWHSVIDWAQRLGDRVAEDDRWLYWHARALELTVPNNPDSRVIYQRVAGNRSFYGFLASEWVEAPYDFNHQPVAVTDADIENLGNQPEFVLIRELYLHDELSWARQEWQLALRGKPQQAWLNAAKIAERWQWHNQAIVTMIQTGYWDDIDVRFPQAHKKAFLSEATATDIPVNLLFALSRQESAFNESVTSPAGAKGLMQLMPATAKETARRHNIHYNTSSELFDPDKNILIGSRYYKEMLTKFDNNRILATAAYNAGPARVYRWQRETQGSLPFDAWIEIIPFKETRNYVQNVLAFSIIYAHHLGLDVEMLSKAEKNTLL